LKVVDPPTEKPPKVKSLLVPIERFKSAAACSRNVVLKVSDSVSVELPTEPSGEEM